MQPREVKNGNAGRFAASAGRSGDRNEWLERAGDGQALADRWVYIIEEITGRICGIEIRRLGGVDGGPTTHGNKSIKRFATGKFNRLVERLVGWLDPRP